ncbi:fimbrial protein [Salmonella enterica subsp. enterica serovar Reading]|nr:fimbrial protein [Salmonella enterica subsp. enterica serovar Reading]EHC4763350.1 fimbrial protein [Salmonella enterica subsp. enterica serovar Reading]EHX6386459.1 fimbrial protein [Salmonella enterica subsp. enterica serovar Reading]
MKKLMIASAIAMTMVAGSVMASQGDVQFFGNVTAATCDVTPDVGGNITNMVQLGTVSTNGTGDEIPLVFKAKNAQGGECQSLTGKTATVAWNGPLTDKGIANQGGVANDAYVILTSTNAKANQAVTKDKNAVDFDAAKAISDGLAFKAQLKGGATAGDFRSAAAYAVTYK